MTARMICSDGNVLELLVERWLGDAATEECGLLENLCGPVIDVGCGPGRHVEALAARGVPALGVDVSRTAVRLARHRSAPVLERSVFDRIPGTGRWVTALLLDGNVGIGGDPVRLLERIKELLMDCGSVVVEVEARGVGCTKTSARIQSAEELSDPFPWARVGIDAIHDVAMTAGFALAELTTGEDRWFARLLVRSTN